MARRRQHNKKTGHGQCLCLADAAASRQARKFSSLLSFLVVEAEAAQTSGTKFSLKVKICIVFDADRSYLKMPLEQRAFLVMDASMKSGAKILNRNNWISGMPRSLAIMYVESARAV